MADSAWQTWGAPASVDWCEPNHLLSAWVAEPWNTGSSLIIAAFGAYGWWWSRQHPATPEARFRYGFFALLVVGLGSAAFHGTLLRTAQAADELPMVYLGLLTMWMVAQRERATGEGRGLAVALGLYGAVFTVAYGQIEGYFGLFIATYAGAVTWVVLRSAWLTWGREGPADLGRLLGGAALTYLGTLAVCWIPEHVLLPCDHPLQSLPLHAGWHLGAGFGTYLWLVWAVADRRRATGVPITLEGTVPRPVG